VVEAKRKPPEAIKKFAPRSGAEFPYTFASGIGGVYFTLSNVSVCAKAVCMMHKHKIGVRNEAKSNFEHFIICFPCSKPHSATLLMDSS
jgi:hypothetical protein